ncbi:MAG: hypothetical protein IK114_08355 [Fibrobacter sp.]|nr:hypothetical protein [Fibrobacter sp.]
MQKNSQEVRSFALVYLAGMGKVNEALVKWVMFFGNIAYVEKPKALQQMILESAKSIVARYE